MYKMKRFLLCLNSYIVITEDKARNLFTVAGLAADRLTVSALLLDRSTLSLQKAADYHVGWIPHSSLPHFHDFFLNYETLPCFKHF